MNVNVDLASVLDGPELDQRLLKLALSRGLVTERSLNDLLVQLVSEAGAVNASELVRKVEQEGLLHKDASSRLTAEVLRLGSDVNITPTAVRPNQASPEVSTLGEAFDLFPVKDWSRYELVEFIGRGGMGDVFKARDPRLNRYVAIKFLRRDDPQILTRFTREAQVQARIDHDNVCPVYEVGEVNGQPYIAMQYVAGGSLKEISDLLSHREKAGIMVDVSDALHAAHRAGLVHRDIKPANIMVEKHHDGSWRPFVVDFGIARDTDSREITATGAVLGTPSFAAPEQIRGETRTIDGRTDLYSLGATLYWFLTGSAPFEGSYPEILAGVANEDPVPPHRLVQDIPVDLETIVLKCLEKEPDRRYESARAVSENLRRFLEGEPIEARRASTLYRLNKKIRKNRGLTIAITSALVVILVLAGINLRSGIEAKRINALTQRFTTAVKEMESIMRTASMMPLHNRNRERELITARMDSIQSEMDLLGPIAQGPGHYALGRGFSALENYDQAVIHLFKAWDNGARDAAVSNALGLALGKIYEKNLGVARAIEDDALRREFKASIEKEFRNPALEHLRSSRDIATEAPAYAEGLIALYEEDYDKALLLAQKAFEQVEWLYEAKKLEGDILVAQGVEKAELGDIDAAFLHFERAGTAYAQASNIARSDAGIYEGDCARWFNVMEAESLIGQPGEKAFNQAIRSCSLALEVEDARPRTFEILGNIYWQRADSLSDRGADPTLLVDQAQAFARNALEIEGRNYRALHILGGSWIVKGVNESKHGKDPRPSFDAAAENLQKALEIQPAFVVARDELGYALERKAKYEQSQGLDPRPSLDLAIKNYERAIELQPLYANAYNNLGIAFWRRAAYERRRRFDAVDSLDRAIAAYEQALEINPNYAYAMLNLGLSHRTRALLDLEAGRDPSSSVTLARQFLSRGLAIKKDVSWALGEVVANEIVASRWAMINGQPPESFLRAARQAADTAIEINPTSADARQTAAVVHRWQAEWLLSQGQSVSYEIEKGRNLVEGALDLNERHAKALLAHAALLLVQAKAEQRESTRQSLARQAKTSLEKALKINPLLEIEAEEMRIRHAEFF